MNPKELVKGDKYNYTYENEPVTMIYVKHTLNHRVFKDGGRDLYLSESTVIQSVTKAI
jgi:hypothetical protein